MSKKKSFIVHDEDTNEEILIASTSFCYAIVEDGTTVININDMEFRVLETLQEVQSLYEETEE